MTALDRMDEVEKDIRAALDWCLAKPQSGWDERHDCGFAILASMNMYWYRFGYIAEGRGWHARALEVIEDSEDVDSPQIVDALHGHGILAFSRATCWWPPRHWSARWRWPRGSKTPPVKRGS